VSEMVLKPIGVVRNGIDQPPTPRGDWARVVSEITVNPDLTEALDGIEECSHIVVLWWMHRLTERGVPLIQNPRRRPEAPAKGLFALRSPNRPNPIGLAAVRLLEFRDNILRVEGLDALDGSPVIDIKPYLPEYDGAPEASIPYWLVH